MKNCVLKLFVVLSSITVIAATSSAQSSKNKLSKEMVNKTIESWPETSKSAAKATMEKYGPPNEATASQLIWHNNGPWKRTIVYSEEVQHNFPMPHKDVLEQFVDMNVPSDKFDDLAAFDGSVVAERTKGELSARCDKEAANFLAINLSKDVIDGKKTVQQARKEYGDSIKAKMSGKSPALTEKLQFEVASSDVTNPDESTIEPGTMSGTTTEP